MDGADARLAAFQRTFQASDLKAKNFVRFPAVNGSALDAARLVSRRAYADIVQGRVWLQRGSRGGPATWQVLVHSCRAAACPLEQLQQR